MIARQGTMMTDKHRWHPICPSPSSHWDADVCEEDNDGDHHNDQNIPPSHNRHHDNHRDLITLVCGTGSSGQGLINWPSRRRATEHL